MTLLYASWPSQALLALALIAVWYASAALAKRLGVYAAPEDSARVYLTHLLTAAAAAAGLWGALMLGLFTPQMAALSPIDWSSAMAWLPGFAAGCALWVALMWGGVWRSLDLDRDYSRHRGAFWQGLAKLITDEATLGLLRGMALWLLSPYWGAWLALAVRALLGWVAPGSADAARGDRGRPHFMLGRALDVISTVVVIMAKSLWLALATRALCYGAAMLVLRSSTGRAVSGPPVEPDLGNRG